MSSYIDHKSHAGVVTLEWRRVADQRLEWLYGFERAWAIRSGRDPATNADIATWNALGRREAA